MPLVIIRADGTFATGFGHLSRSLALGEALERQGFKIGLLGQGFERIVSQFSLLPTLLLSPNNVGGEAEDAMQVLQHSPDFVVVDGYHFSRSFFAVLEAAEIPFLVIDDYGQTKSLAPTMLVNQSPGPIEPLYSHFKSGTKLFLGPQYCLIRQEFGLAKNKFSASDRLNVFLNFGASDPHFMTEQVVGISLKARLPVSVALGPRAPRRDKRLRALQDSGAQVSDPLRFAENLARSKLAIIAGGTTLWEAAFLGVPALVIIIADNQRSPVASAQRAGLVDWVIDGTMPENHWHGELEQALREYKAHEGRYVIEAQPRAGMVGNLGPPHLAQQIQRALT